jgi:hypothetical protein
MSVAGESFQRLAISFQLSAFRLSGFQPAARNLVILRLALLQAEGPVYSPAAAMLPAGCIGPSPLKAAAQDDNG